MNWESILAMFAMDWERDGNLFWAILAGLVIYHSFRSLIKYLIKRYYHENSD
jgi:hypothetical protein